MSLSSTKWLPKPTHAQCPATHRVVVMLRLVATTKMGAMSLSSAHSYTIEHEISMKNEHPTHRMVVMPRLVATTRMGAMSLSSARLRKEKHSMSSMCTCKGRLQASNNVK